MVAVVIGAIKFRFSLREEKYLILLMICCLAAELTTRALWHFEKNNLWVSHVFTPIESTLLLLFFAKKFKKVISKLILVLAACFVVLAVVNMFFFDSLFRMNALAKSIECVLLIGVSLLLWVKVMKDLKIQRLMSTTVFWINSAVLLYFSSTVLLFIFSQLILKSQELSIWIWTFHFVFMVIYYVLFSIGLWKIKRI